MLVFHSSHLLELKLVGWQSGELYQLTPGSQECSLSLKEDMKLFTTLRYNTYTALILWCVNLPAHKMAQ